MKQTDICSNCGHQAQFHSGACNLCGCLAFVPKGSTSPQLEAKRNQRIDLQNELHSTRERFIGSWRINWCWYAHLTDHGDGTCTIISFDRSKNPPPFEEGNIVEDESRNVIAVRTNKGEQLKVRNSKHVFSYKKES